MRHKEVADMGSLSEHSTRSLRRLRSGVFVCCVMLLCLMIGAVSGISVASPQLTASQPQPAFDSERVIGVANEQHSTVELLAVRIYDERTDAGDTAATATGTTGTGVPDESAAETWPTATVVGGLSLVISLSGLLWVARRYTETASTAGQRPENTDQQPAPREPTEAPETLSSGSDDTPTGAESTADGPPEHLLSNEERILRLIRENGGRIKQQRVVSEFDWSAARTSQLVGELRDDGEIDSFRLGRENVLRLPDEDD